MEKSYRIRTDIGNDLVVHAHLKQDIDFLEILSLKINQEDTYTLHTSNYGIIVGRVLANEAFGIPNAKVSVFIPLDDDDAKNSEISSIYPYKTLQDLNKDNIRYNLLPNSSNDDCYKAVGTFPNKRTILDNDTQIEVYEKYWKYTTVTNQSGDYMIFGVPKGTHQVHVDIDLSDIGILSQKPRDFVYKGYNIEQFDNASQFKDSTNLDSLTQLFSQNSSVYVYPFWGESDVEEIAITRCDLQIQYKFEPTCVFFGSIISDNYTNNINDKCAASKEAGYNRNLIAGEGTIEMIRKTTSGLVEEFPIQGNRLIDGNGVWCYQIPMNLDYIGMDEFGNIVPTDDPKKGIATRTSVRFRFSMQETENEGVSRHRAKYLVPNNFELVGDSNLKPQIANPSEYEQCYEFGSATPDKHFRDLYWNKVYTVKNYIPRLQNGDKHNSKKFSAIKSVNLSGNLNPFPFNNARFKLPFTYRLLCIISHIIVDIVGMINKLLAGMQCFKLTLIEKHALEKWFIKWPPKNIDVDFTDWFKVCVNKIHCIGLKGEMFDDDDEIIYMPNCKNFRDEECDKCTKWIKETEPNATVETETDVIKDKIEQALAEEYEVVNLDFYNDWVNGVLYFPLWFWKRVKKKRYLWGLIKTKGVNRFCNCDDEFKKLSVVETCSIDYEQEEENPSNKYAAKINNNNPHKNKVSSIKTTFGIIKEKVNKLGKYIYYYSPGKTIKKNYANTTTSMDFVRLYSTDIVLLGSLNECDINGLPRPYINLPSTTSNIPFIGALVDDYDSSSIEFTGMDWGANASGNDYKKGMLFGLTCNVVSTRHKSCVNLHRLSELGVNLDGKVYNTIPKATDGVLTYIENEPDGKVTRYEITDNETRSMIASLNHNGLNKLKIDSNTNYKTYDLKYKYVSDFDGNLEKDGIDIRNEEYVRYRFGEKIDGSINYLFYNGNSNNHSLPLYNNSFYFYFGLNEGNTAIDKFNNLFYSTCYKNDKTPFSLKYTTKPSDWCDEDSAEINFELSGIKTPFRYKLYDSEGSEQTEYSQIDQVNKSISLENLKNGIYTLEVTDALEQTLLQEIVINPVYLSIDYTITNLGCKYDNEDRDIDIIDQGGEGKIIINHFNIDGEDYDIDNIVEIVVENDDNVTSNEREEDDIEQIDAEGGDNTTNNGWDKNNNFNKSYSLTVKRNDDDIKYIKLGVEYDNTEYNYTNVKYTDKDDNNNDVTKYFISDLVIETDNDDKYILITSTRPCTLEFEYVLLCKKENKEIYTETKNISHATIHVINGIDFMAFINNVPIDEIVDYDSSSSSDSYIIDNLNGIDNIFTDYSKLLNLPSLNSNNKISKTDFIKYLKYVGFDNEEYKEDLNQDEKNKIIVYKLQSYFNLLKGLVFVDDNSVSLSITHEGGTPQIIYRTIQPNYFIEAETIDSFICDNYGYVSCLNDYANIILELDESNKEIFNLNNKINTSSYIGFASYTNNGESPKESKPKGLSDEIPSISTYNWNGLKGDYPDISKFKKFWFIDRRFGYDFTITLNEKTLNENTENDSKLYNLELSGKYYGGVKMGKNDNGYIISNSEKSTYQYNDTTCGITINNSGYYYDSECWVNNDTNNLNILEKYNSDNTVNVNFEEIDNADRFHFMQQSYSYNIDVYVDENENSTNRIKYLHTPSETVEFDIDLSNRMVMTDTDLDGDKCGLFYCYDNYTASKPKISLDNNKINFAHTNQIKDNKGNVTKTEYNGDIYINGEINKDVNGEINNDIEFKFTEANLAWNMISDRYNSTHRTITSIPKVCGTRINEEDKEENISYDLSYEVDLTNYDKSKNNSSVLFGNDGRDFYYFVDNKGSVLYDDDPLISNMKFGIFYTYMKELLPRNFHFEYYTRYENDENNVTRNIIYNTITKDIEITKIQSINLQISFEAELIKRKELPEIDKMKPSDDNITVTNETEVSTIDETITNTTIPSTDVPKYRINISKVSINITSIYTDDETESTDETVSIYKIVVYVDNNKIKTLYNVSKVDLSSLELTPYRYTSIETVEEGNTDISISVYNVDITLELKIDESDNYTYKIPFTVQLGQDWVTSDIDNINTSLENNTNTINDNTNNIKIEFSTIDGTLNGNNETVGLIRQVATINSDVDKVSTQVSTLQTSVDTANKNITEIQGSITEIEKDIVDINGKIDLTPMPDNGEVVPDNNGGELP
ncbi:MAG: hypothetical protein IKT40_07495 [Bacilli bacterium]|nr:hypothetical protein [Bacilli bacterium]